MTEQEMRELEAPHPKTIGELNDYIASLVAEVKDVDENNHEALGDAYGKCVYIMSLTAVAAFNYAAGQIGASGFQAGCADLDFLKRTRRMKDGFQIIDWNKFLYPQYMSDKVMSAAFNALEPESIKRIAAAAVALLAESDQGHIHPNVLEHWRTLALLA